MMEVTPSKISIQPIGIPIKVVQVTNEIKVPKSRHIQELKPIITIPDNASKFLQNHRQTSNIQLNKTSNHPRILFTRPVPPSSTPNPSIIRRRLISGEEQRKIIKRFEVWPEDQENKEVPTHVGAVNRPTKCFFVSNSKTAQPSTRRKKQRRTINPRVQKRVLAGTEDNVSGEAANISPKIKPIIFDVSKDKLTAAWLSLVKSVKVARDMTRNKGQRVLGTSQDTLFEFSVENPNSKSLERSDSKSISRPASGEKRSASSSLSSSSSSSSLASNDEDHPQTLPSKEESLQEESFRSTPSAPTTKKPPRIFRGKKLQRRDDPLLTSPHLSSTSKSPASSSFGEVLPMKMRSFPKSFWQQPNHINPTSYCVLPPVQSLFKNHSGDDVTNIRPIEDQIQEDVIVKTGDTDLLMRLFDSLDSNDSKSGEIKIKRSVRSKINLRNSNRAKLGFDDNPYIIESISEKLLSRLSINRHLSGSDDVTDSKLEESLLRNKNMIDDVYAAITPSLRHEVLPQLVPDGGESFSQLLSEVVSVL